MFMEFKMSEISKIAETLRGEFEWVNIRGEGKENMQGVMQYIVNLVIDPDQVDKATTDASAAEAKAFIKRMNDFWLEHKPTHIKKAKSMGYYQHSVLETELDGDGEKVYTPTGKTLLVFKTGTTYKDGKPKVIKVFNKKNNLVDIGELLIGNGSMGRCSGAMAIYEVKPPKGKKALEAGVTLYLDAIKLLKLVEYEGATKFDDDSDKDVEDAWGDGEAEWGEEEPKAKVRL